MNSPNGKYIVEAAQVVPDEKIRLVPGMESGEKDGADNSMPSFSKAGETRIDRKGNRYIKAGGRWLQVATLMSKARVKEAFDRRKGEVTELEEGTIIALVTPDALKQMETAKKAKNSRPTKSSGNSR